jgi:hypothetical protein
MYCNMHHISKEDVMPKQRTKTDTLTVRMTPEAKRLLLELAHANGLSMAAMLEVIIRAEAKREGIK